MHFRSARWSPAAADRDLWKCAQRGRGADQICKQTPWERSVGRGEHDARASSTCAGVSLVPPAMQRPAAAAPAGAALSKWVRSGWCGTARSVEEGAPRTQQHCGPHSSHAKAASALQWGHPPCGSA